MHVKDRIKGFIIRELVHEGNRAALSDGESLLERGIIDSLGLLRVLGFLEEEYQLAIRDEDVVPENFESIEAIAAFVERHREGATGG